MKGFEKLDTEIVFLKTWDGMSWQDESSPLHSFGLGILYFIVSNVHVLHVRIRVSYYTVECSDK